MTAAGEIRSFRAQFPVLEQPLAYLDSAAKTLTPRRVLEAMTSYYVHVDANPGRSLHRLSQQARAAIEEARASVAGLIGAPPEEVVFVRGTTEAINMVAGGLGLTSGDHVVSTVLEHHSNLCPWLRLCSERGVAVHLARADRHGFIDPDDVRRLTRAHRARVVAFTWVSNALGTVQPIGDIAAAARAEGALVVIDGAQGVPHLPCEEVVQKTGCDFLAWSGHKMFGPTGTGALWINPQHAHSLRPLMVGGGGVRDVTAAGFELEREPAYAGLEHGTSDAAGIVGFGEAARLMTELRASVGLRDVMKETVGWTARQLATLPGVHLAVPPTVATSGVLSFWVEDVSTHRVAALLDSRYGVLVRSGHHCALPTMRQVLEHPEGTVRASFHLYSSMDDAARLVAAVSELCSEADQELA